LYEFGLLLQILDETAFVEVVRPEFFHDFGLFIMGLDASLQVIVRIVDAFLMGVAPLGERANDQLANVICNFTMVFSGLVMNGSVSLLA
jgi:hypothetical protein